MSKPKSVEQASCRLQEAVQKTQFWDFAHSQPARDLEEKRGLISPMNVRSLNICNPQKANSNVHSLDENEDVDCCLFQHFEGKTKIGMLKPQSAVAGFVKFRISNQGC